MKKLILLLSIIALPLSGWPFFTHKPHDPAKLEAIKQQLLDQQARAYRDLEHVMVFEAAELKEKKAKLQKEFIEYITAPSQPYDLIAYRDPALPQSVIDQVEKNLKKMGINPKKIHIQKSHSHSSLFGLEYDISCQEIPQIKRIYINIHSSDFDPSKIDATTTHEGKHALEGHVLNRLIHDAFKKRVSLYEHLSYKAEELVADGIPAIQDPNIAKQHYLYHQCHINNNRTPYTLEELAKSCSPGDTHPTDSSRCQLAQDILIAHFGKMPKNL